MEEKEVKAKEEGGKTKTEQNSKRGIDSGWEHKQQMSDEEEGCFMEGR